MDKEIPILFREKSECCACGACLNACPQHAISMQEDAYGFLYPRIDETKCIRCGKCTRVCAFQHRDVVHEPLQTFAGVARSAELAAKSASGGIFAAIAGQVLENGGTVFGAALQEDFTVRHMAVTQKSELHLLQGSKYTQSDIADTYVQAKICLREGKTVLFSGTPCQVAGLYGFLGGEPENLLTVDIVCHGVPGNKMFREYIQTLGGGKPVSEFRFRDKSLGWGINGSIRIDGKRKKIWQSASPYLYYFTRGWIYRENCYHCKYACRNRPADLTLGDYWGIEKQHPEYLGSGKWEESRGISLVVANTERGAALLHTAGDRVELKPSTFGQAAAGNAQLRAPSAPGCREQIMQTYLQGGWPALDQRFRKNIGWRYYSSQIKAMIPPPVKRKLKARK